MSLASGLCACLPILLNPTRYFRWFPDRLLISRPKGAFLEKKKVVFNFSSNGHLGGPGDSQSMGNRLLSYAGDIPGLNLPDRVELVTELGHFVGDLPSNPAEAGMSSQGGQIVGKSIESPLKIHWKYIEMHWTPGGHPGLGWIFLAGLLTTNIQNTLALALFELCWANLFKV